MSCIPCTKVNTTEKGVISYYKDLYKTKGIVHYVYRLSRTSGVKFVEKKYFSTIFENQIKPNFSIGAEYFHISEFS